MTVSETVTDVVVVHSYNSNALRSIIVNGEPQFSALDIGNILGLSNMPRRTSNYSVDEVSMHHLPTRSYDKPMLVLSVVGIYKLFSTCSKPLHPLEEARIVSRVVKWFESVVLPNLYMHHIPTAQLMKIYCNSTRGGATC